jgi:hypothetical protein
MPRVAPGTGATRPDKSSVVTVIGRQEGQCADQVARFRDALLGEYVEQLRRERLPDPGRATVTPATRPVPERGMEASSRCQA